MLENPSSTTCPVSLAKNQQHSLTEPLSRSYDFTVFLLIISLLFGLSRISTSIRASIGLPQYLTL
jgi:hypothetical protein